MSIRIEDVSYYYEQGTAMQVKALDHVSTEIPDDSFVGLIGHTGSGKSTLIQTLNGLLKVSEGRILFNGEDIDGKDYDRRALRAQVGLVFQYPEHQLFEADVLTDVMFGPRNLGLSEEEARERAVKALQMVGLGENYYDHSPFDMSGGQKRRAAIAGVLAMQPRVLILDEPTAGLDPGGRADILEMIAQMRRELHMTVLLVSHSMDDVARYADRILVMAGGKLLMDDVPSQIFARSEELERTGLAAPQISYALRQLRDRGLPVETSALTAEEAAAEILRALRGKGRYV